MVPNTKAGFLLGSPRKTRCAPLQASTIENAINTNTIKVFFLNRRDKPIASMKKK